MVPNDVLSQKELWIARLAMITSIAIFLLWATTMSAFWWYARDHSKCANRLKSVGKWFAKSMPMLILSFSSSTFAVIALVAESIVVKRFVSSCLGLLYLGYLGFNDWALIIKIC